MPSVPLSSQGTLARGTLYDVHDAVRKKIIEELPTVQGQALCVTFNG